MKPILPALLLASTMLLAGCGTPSGLQSSAEYQRTEYSRNLKRDIDRQIRAEIHKELPVGSTASAYSDTEWFNYWTKMVAEFRTDFPKSKDYRGPTGKQFADYIVTTRREQGLPELPSEKK